MTYDLVDHFGAGTGGFQSVQAAVDAAHASDIIMLAPTTYTEQVVIDPAHGHGADNITIQGMAGATLQAPGLLEQNGVSPTNARSIDGLITVDGATGVSIKGLTVDGLHHGDSFGSTPAQNDPELVGIAFLNSTGGSIDGVTVTGMRESDNSIGDQRNLGIYVSNTDPTAGSVPTADDVANHTLNTISITNSTIADFQKGGIVATNAEVTISGNTLTGVGPVNTSQNAIQVSGSTGEVSDNTISNIANTSAPPNDDAATGILAFFNNGLVIDHNTFTGAEVGGQVVDTTVGVYVLDSDNGQITNNVSHNADDGASCSPSSTWV